MKCAIGMTAGAVGAFVGTPAEISLIRMTSDGRYLFYHYGVCMGFKTLHIKLIIKNFHPTQCI